MRKTAAIFLLCVYVLIQAVSVCWYFYKPLAHSYFRQQSVNSLVDERNGLISITINRDKLDELKNEEGEIVINGVLYDVQLSAASGSMIKLLLKKDSDETNWNIHYKKINNLLYKHAGGRHTASGNISLSLFPLFHCKETITNLCFVQYLHKQQGYASTNFSAGPVKELVTPPPRRC